MRRFLPVVIAWLAVGAAAASAAPPAELPDGPAAAAPVPRGGDARAPHAPGRCDARPGERRFPAGDSVAFARRGRLLVCRRGRAVDAGHARGVLRVAVGRHVVGVARRGRDGCVRAAAGRRSGRLGCGVAVPSLVVSRAGLAALVDRGSRLDVVEVARRRPRTLDRDVQRRRLALQAGRIVTWRRAGAGEGAVLGRHGCHPVREGVVRDGRAVVSVEASRADAAGDRLVWMLVCDTGTGVTRLVASGTDGDYPFAVPSIVAVRTDRLLWREDTADRYGASSVRLWTRTLPLGTDRLSGGCGGCTVPRAFLTAAGATLWSSAAVPPGEPAAVLRTVPGERSQALDRDVAVDAASLVLDGVTARWTTGGVRREAPAP